MTKSRFQNLIFTALGLALLIGAGFQFKKNREHFLTKPDFLKTTKAKNQRPSAENSRGIKGWETCAGRETRICHIPRLRNGSGCS